MNDPHSTLESLRAVLLADRHSCHTALNSLATDPLFGSSPAAETTAGHLAYERLALLGSAFGMDRTCVKDPQRFFALEEWAAVVDPSLAALLAAHLNLCLGTIAQLGDSPEAEDALEQLESGRATGSFLATEAAYGSDLPRLRTRARYDPARDRFILSTPDDSAVKFMPNNALRHVPKIAVVLARLVVGTQDRGVYPFLCPLGRIGRPAEGVHITPLPDKPGMHTDNALTRFHDVHLPRGALLDHDGHQRRALRTGAAPPADRRAAFDRAVARVSTGKAGLSAVSASMARAAVTIAVRFAQHRHASGGGATRIPLISHRVHHASVIDAVADTYAASLLANTNMREAAVLAASDSMVPSSDQIHRFTFTKYLVTSTCHDVLLTAQRLCGAHGMFGVNRIPYYLAVNRGCMTAEGENTVIALAAVKEVLLTHRNAPPDIPPPPLPTPGDTSAWLALAHARERRALATCHHRREAARSQHTQYLDVWNACSAQTMRLAERHAHRLALESLHQGQAAAEDPDARHLLGALAEVYAIRDLRKDAADTLAQGQLSPTDLPLLAERLADLHASLAPQLPLLTDAFAIPASLLDVPAATPAFIRRYVQLHSAGAGHA